MKVFQRELTLSPKRRGFHLVTDEILRTVSEDVARINAGLMHVFIKHTSASLTINENADPTVRTDFERHFSRMIPEGEHYVHDSEGRDDMPAHLKASVLGSSVTLPISNGRLNVGIWQGIYLCEHRDQGGPRSLLITITGI